MLGVAASVFGATYPWHELTKWGRIAVASVVLLFGLPPLIALWMTGVL